MNAWTYGIEDIHELAGLLADGLMQNHPFVDGNKRTGFVACLTFLRANGWMLNAPMSERFAYTLMLAAGEIEADAYAAWLRDKTEAA